MIIILLSIIRNEIIYTIPDRQFVKVLVFAEQLSYYTIYEN
jgi:hypothetical protein